MRWTVWYKSGVHVSLNKALTSDREERSAVLVREAICIHISSGRQERLAIIAGPAALLSRICRIRDVENLDGPI